VTMKPDWIMERRQFTQELKLESVRLTMDRGLSYANDIGET